MPKLNKLQSEPGELLKVTTFLEDYPKWGLTLKVEESFMVGRQETEHFHILKAIQGGRRNIWAKKWS